MLLLKESSFSLVIEHDCEIGIHLFIAIVLHIDAYIYNVAHLGIVIADNRHIGVKNPNRNATFFGLKT